MHGLFSDHFGIENRLYLPLRQGKSRFWSEDFQRGYSTRRALSHSQKDDFNKAVSSKNNRFSNNLTVLVKSSARLFLAQRVLHTVSRKAENRCFQPFLWMNP